MTLTVVCVYILNGIIVAFWLNSYHEKPIPRKHQAGWLLLVAIWPLILLYLYLWERQMRRRVLKEFEQALRNRSRE